MIEIYENPAHKGWTDLSEARLLVGQPNYESALKDLILLLNEDLVDTVNCYIILKNNEQH